MNIIFKIDGGLGKSIMGTAMLKVIKKKYPKSNIIVLTHYKDVFLNNPNVYKCLKLNETFEIYKNEIKDKDCKVFVANPYGTSDFILDQNHLYTLWCDMFGLEYNGEMPEIYLTNTEKNYYSNVYHSNKPILALQTHGGGENQELKYNWSRDMPFPLVQGVINRFKDEYTICHIKGKSQPSYNHTKECLESYRGVAILLLQSKKRLFIDSFSQHMAAALRLPSVVCWVTTKPKMYGYELHKNIVANKFTKEPEYAHSNLQPFSLYEDIKEIPYNNLTEIFDSETVIKNILSL
tara:strand:- start:188 stop:1063 length:876 start_codon:yes stop_codon:yes gene_type:complete